MNSGFSEFLSARLEERCDVFLGTPEQNVEKDFWVTWTPDALSRGLPEGHPPAHVGMFFNSPDFGLSMAPPGTFSLSPIEGISEELRRDYWRSFGPKPPQPKNALPSRYRFPGGPIQ